MNDFQSDATLRDHTIFGLGRDGMAFPKGLAPQIQNTYAFLEKDASSTFTRDHLPLQPVDNHLAVPNEFIQTKPLAFTFADTSRPRPPPQPYVLRTNTELLSENQVYPDGVKVNTPLPTAEQTREAVYNMYKMKVQNALRSGDIDALPSIDEWLLVRDPVLHSALAQGSVPTPEAEEGAEMEGGVGADEKAEAGMEMEAEVEDSPVKKQLKAVAHKSFEARKVLGDMEREERAKRNARRRAKRQQRRKAEREQLLVEARELGRGARMRGGRDDGGVVDLTTITREQERQNKRATPKKIRPSIVPLNETETENENEKDEEKGDAPPPDDEYAQLRERIIDLAGTLSVQKITELSEIVIPEKYGVKPLENADAKREFQTLVRHAFIKSFKKVFHINPSATDMKEFLSQPARIQGAFPQTYTEVKRWVKLTFFVPESENYILRRIEYERLVAIARRRGFKKIKDKYSEDQKDALITLLKRTPQKPTKQD